LVTYKDSEILTTKQKLVDCAKAARDLDHRSTVSLKEGILQTLKWMAGAYGVNATIRK
jgi:dTDP-glucose 4,6-dehydratase